MKKLFCVLLPVLFLLSSCYVSDIEDSGMVTSEESNEYIPDNSVFGVAFASCESSDPYTTSNKLNAEFMGLVCEPLFSVSDTFEVTPVLCRDYSYSDREYTFNIKDGVTFSDGSALTASDVEYSLRAAMGSGSYYATRLAIIENISSSDRGNFVKVRLKYDNARFPALLDIPIIKRNTRNSIPPTGTGLYAPKDDLSALVARRDHHSGKTPVYSVISICDVTSSDELIYEFDTHNVSLLTSDPTGSTHITPISRAARTNVVTTQLHYLGFNTRNATLSDKSVRRAIARAIDRENAAAADFALMGNPAELPVHPKSSSYPHESAKDLFYDGETAISVSAPLTILVNSDNSGKLAVCKRIAETLSRLGAPTTVRALPFDEYTSALRSGDFTLYYAEVALGADFDITRLISGSLNFGGFYDASLINAHSAYLAGDEGKNEFFRIFCDTVPFAPIMFKDTAMYTQENFFEKTSPTSQNIYNSFCDWTVKNIS
ncbi:MAG: ABC transporter substrate-binding protein [Oscillospiraceae bacterium]|nr:ABC transporter substrate-binding protein [Oscillospiraceae bacterium]